MATAVETTINYYLEPSLGGITHYVPGTAGILRRKFDTRPVRINDLRGIENDFQIHENSFQLCPFQTDVKDINDKEEVKRVMYPEQEEFIKKLTGATKVICFSHLIRRDTVESNKAALDALEAKSVAVPDDHGFGKIVPARFAHLDQSPKGANTLLNDNMPELAGTLSKTRWGTVNIWRPLKTIKRDPLTVCDSQTVRDEDLAPVDTTLPKKGVNTYDAVSKGEGFQSLELRASSKHKWYYASNLTPDECLVFKIYDSKKSIKGRCAHTAFTDPKTKDGETRESMELRFFVFYEEESTEE